MNNDEKRKYNAKPMTLYVNTGGVSEIDLNHIGVQADRIIDIELSEIDAKKLHEMLTRRLSVEVYGTITFRLQGRLIL